MLLLKPGQMKTESLRALLSWCWNKASFAMVTGGWVKEEEEAGGQTGGG